VSEGVKPSEIERVMHDFLSWIKEPGNVDPWDQEFVETWVLKYLEEKVEVTRRECVGEALG